MQHGIRNRRSIGIGALCLTLLLSCAVADAADYYLWLFDEGRGEVSIDSGTYGIDMEIVNPEWSEAGPFPDTSALHLDGSGQTYAYFGRAIGADQATLEMWIRPARLVGTQNLFSTKWGSTSRLYFWLVHGDLVVSDQYWQQHNNFAAPGAFTQEDLGKWAHVALSWGPDGYRLYKNGSLLVQNDLSPFPYWADRGAAGISAWNLSGEPFAGDISQVRLSLEELPPGQGTGRGELAWAASLAGMKMIRPDLEWLPVGLDGNILIRERPVLTLRVRNRFLQPIHVGTVTVRLQDKFTDGRLHPLQVVLDEAIPPRDELRVPVDLEIAGSGVYEVTAVGPDQSQVQTDVTLVQGPAPEDYDGPVPFFGTNAHHYEYPWDFLLRREFGSRLERAMIYWHGQTDPDNIEWLAEDDPLLTVVPRYGGSVYGFSGYTPSYASPEPEGTQSVYDVPIISHYRNWMEAAPRHYRPHIKYWEIWNEPNAHGTFFRGSAEDLADLHKTGFLAVRRTAPGVKIVGASTVGIGLQYLDRLRDAGALDYMDVIAVHAYRWDYPPDLGLSQALKSVVKWRDKYAPGRPVWDNEFGYTNEGWSPSRHASIVARHLVIDKALGIQHADLYTWRWAPNYLFSGVWPTPSALAYRTVAQRLTNAVPVAAIYEGEDDVFAYLFERRGVYTLVAWTTEEQDGRLTGIPVVPSKAALCDLMGNPESLPTDQASVSLPLTNSPVFLQGVDASWRNHGRALSASPNEGPPPRHSSVWYSFHYPPGSEVVSLPCGATRSLPFQLYNDGEATTTIILNLSARDGPLALSRSSWQVRVPPRSSRRVSIPVSAPQDVPEDTYRVHVSAEAGGVSCGEMTIRCYVTEGETMFFNMATWEMAQNLVAAEGYGQGLGRRWINPDGHLTFKFDLTEATSAYLSSLMRSSTPTTDGGTFRLCASVDGEEWEILLEAEGEEAWREVDISAYAGNEVLLRFDNSSDKGYVVLRALRLVTNPPRPESPRP